MSDPVVEQQRRYKERNGLTKRETAAEAVR
jgi:hypothetical protein